MSFARRFLCILDKRLSRPTCGGRTSFLVTKDGVKSVRDLMLPLFNFNSFLGLVKDSSKGTIFLMERSDTVCSLTWKLISSNIFLIFNGSLRVGAGETAADLAKNKGWLKLILISELGVCSME